MKKQKVLIVHNYYQVPGGEDTVVENEKKMLLKNGHEVFVYTRHNNEIKKKRFIDKLLLPIETIFSLKTYKDIKKIIREENIEIVHVHNTLPLVSPSVYYAAKKCRKPIVQTIHNFRLLCPAATLTRENNICEECIKKSLFCSVKNRCYRDSLIQSLISAINLSIHRMIGTYNKIDAYIALTDFNKEKLKILIKSEKIFIKPNFVDSCDENLVSIEERRYFIYLGRIDKLKGIDLILRAWKEIKDEALYIVGSGPFEQEARKYVKENNMSNVKFLGYKEKNEVKKILSHSKALILASQCYEGFPMTIIESFALGVPVIGGDIGNISRIIKDEENGLLYKYDSYEELITKIRMVNNELLKKLSLGARKDFDNKYNDAKNYNKLIEIYKCLSNKI